MSKTAKPSIKTISELTGFSPATVSNALNRKYGVNKETSDKIFQVAEEIGYNISYRSLTSIKFVLFRRDGAIVDDSPFHPAVIAGVESAAKENGLSTLFIRLDRSSPDYEEQVHELVSDPSGGIILLSTELLDDDCEPFTKCRCPVILLDGWSEKVPINGVLINNTDSAITAVNYLISQGHRNIGYIRGNSRIKAFQARESGYREAMLRHQLPVNPAWTVTVGTKTETAFSDMMSWLSSGPSLPTAFFVDNDLIAYGAIRALNQNGIRIPDQISVVGFDDLPYSSVSNPLLTTIRVNGREMGEEAVQRLLDIIKRPQRNILKIECCTDFIVRESVRKNPAGMPEKYI